jgi:hypothetical protein
MKTHRPWQPHMSSTPLFNPYASPTGRGTTLDRFGLVEEEEVESSGEQSTDQAAEQPPVAEQD